MAIRKITHKRFGIVCFGSFGRYLRERTVILRRFDATPRAPPQPISGPAGDVEEDALTRIWWRVREVRGNAPFRGLIREMESKIWYAKWDSWNNRKIVRSLPGNESGNPIIPVFLRSTYRESVAAAEDFISYRETGFLKSSLFFGISASIKVNLRNCGWGCHEPLVLRPFSHFSHPQFSYF